MKIALNKKYIITTDGWFIAPDGEQYRAVFGTVTEICNDNETLGIKTDRGSANWYIVIGNMVVAGCQMHYCIRANSINKEPVNQSFIHEGKLIFAKNRESHIYCADEIKKVGYV